MTDELYHFGVKGMKWGVRKAQIQAKADAYRNAADNAKTRMKRMKLLDKADKFDKKAAKVDTAPSKVAYHAKRGALATAGVLAGIGALTMSFVGGEKFMAKEMIKEIVG